MAGESSWFDNPNNDTSSDIKELGSFSELSDEDKEESLAASMNLILPDDILERILAILPIASIFRAGSVCKRWSEIVSSNQFLRSLSRVMAQKPWYFMFTSSDEPSGYTYDPLLRKWYNIDLPCIETSNWFIASSCGLVSCIDNDTRSQLYVFNPITRRWRKVIEPPGVKLPDYGGHSISTNMGSQGYTVSLVKSNQVPGDFFQWDLSIHLYDSCSKSWATPVNEILNRWRGGDESVICNGVLYFLIYSAGGSAPENRHGLIAYDLDRALHGSLMRSFVPVPCPLTCGRLMNLKEKLVMVGGIGKQDRPDIIKGIGIWVLNGTQWQEISRMPHKFFQGFGELDDVFASSGINELIYIQSYGAPTLLLFDMRLRQWRWSQRCPVTKRFPLHLFSGFCFEPRLEVVP